MRGAVLMLLVVLASIFGVCTPKKFILPLPRFIKPGRLSGGHKMVAVGRAGVVARAGGASSFLLLVPPDFESGRSAQLVFGGRSTSKNIYLPLLAVEALLAWSSAK